MNETSDLQSRVVLLSSFSNFLCTGFDIIAGILYTLCIISTFSSKPGNDMVQRYVPLGWLLFLFTVIE